MTTSVGFDIYVKDRASGEMTRVGSSFKKAADEAEKSKGRFSSLASTIGKIGAGFAAWEGAKKGVEFLKSSTEAASQDQAAQRKLALALQNTTHANKDQISGVQEWITKQSEALGISKDDIMPAFERLAESTGSVTKAQKELKLAFDVSAGTGKDLGTVSMALMKANNGTTASLSRLGLQTKENVKNTAAIKAAQVSAQTAQLSYNATVKKYGPASAQARIASEKLAAAHKKVTAAQKTSATQTLTLNQAMKKMSDTFGGQAKAKAHGFDGTMQRLSATWHEAKVQVGDALIPVLQKFANWVIGKGIPAVQRFGAQFKAGTGDAGKLRAALSDTGKAVVAVAGFLNKHRAVVEAVVAAWVMWKATTVAWNAVQAISLVRLKMQTVGTIENAVATKVSAAASKAWAAAQWLLNAAMDANPIGLVVLAVAALAVGMVIAYKKSATFRAIVQGAFHAVEGAAKSVADFFTHKVPAAFDKVKAAASNALGWVKSNWPLILAVLTGPFGIAALVIAKNWDKIKAGAQNAVHAVTGFFSSLPGKIKSALGNLGSLLLNAGKQIVQGLLNGIQSMVGSLTSKLKDITNLIPKIKGPIDKDRILLQPAGVAIMEGLIHGIQSKKVALATVLSQVTSAVQAAGQKLQAAIQARNSFAAGFQNFSTSAFGADFGTDANGNAVAPTAASIIAYQKQQRAQAKTVKTDVHKLVKMGLSPALIKQLQAQGAAGIPELEALAHASPAQIRQYNRLNKQTTSDLRSAGMSAANRLYGKQIAQDRKSDNEIKKILAEIRDAVKHHGKEKIEVTLNGQHVDFVLAKERRTKGHLQSDKKS